MSINDMKFPKASWTNTKGKKRQQSKKKPIKLTKGYPKVKSIMQEKSDKRCYLCMLLDGDYREHAYTEEHHVLFGNQHKLSDWYGLRVNLCLNHHRIGSEAVHNNQKNAEILKAKAQERFMEVYPKKDWMEIVGKDYL